MILIKQNMVLEKQNHFHYPLNPAYVLYLIWLGKVGIENDSDKAECGSGKIESF